MSLDKCKLKHWLNKLQLFIKLAISYHQKSQPLYVIRNVMKLISEGRIVTNFYMVAYFMMWFLCWQSRCGHTFVQAQFNIYTVCEYCSSYIWVLEKAQVCKGKSIVHIYTCFVGSEHLNACILCSLTQCVYSFNVSIFYHVVKVSFTVFALSMFAMIYLFLHA